MRLSTDSIAQKTTLYLARNNPTRLTRHKLTQINTLEIGADENALSSKAKQSFVTTLKLFASQKCKLDL